MAAAKGTATWSLFPSASQSWFSSATGCGVRPDPGSHGNCACATWDMMETARAARLASVWKEMTGTSAGSGFLARNARRLSYVRSSRDCKSPCKWNPRGLRFTVQGSLIAIKGFTPPVSPNPATSYRGTGRVWEITGSSSRLQENYW